eukprot:TRINITY_DN1626_c0_g1_i10.p1 TRINITY_DN1626_c0_g1~~TRINITY_DN1626_c0_g1_i10.p1  ORF type:complete len:290 (-),score=59.24 TRINITY_DN1626_c0_g1_i10:159-1028(-)
MLEVARRFFGQPEEEKMKISITNSKVFRGYQQLGQNITKYQRDWHEAIDLFAEPKGVDLTIYDPSRPLHGLNQWPVYPPKFREISEKYVEAMLGLGKQIMRIMALGLELPFNYFEPFTSDPFWIFRVLGYPPTPRQNISGDFGDRDHADQMEINYGCGVHTDYGCVTIVNQDTVGGLQVQTLDGKWIDGPPLPGTFVINIGDMLSHWTNGLYKSTQHRVVNKTPDKFRVSVPFFFEPNYDAVIVPLDVQPTTCKRSPLGSEPLLYGDHVVKKVLTNFDEEVYNTTKTNL